MKEWFERWFGEEYLHVYLHRDEEDAERLVALLEREGVGRRGHRVLDVACGPGRHAAALGRRGARVTGLDLSMPLLSTARRRTTAPLVRGDMRALPFRSRIFDAVVNLFTSFGYFDLEEEHVRVVSEVARVLKPGGLFVLDFLNAPAVRATLVPRDEQRFGDTVVVQERRLADAGRFVVKSIHMSGSGRTYSERVRLFERSDLERMLDRVGLRTRACYGDYDGAPHTALSPRLVLTAVCA